MNKIKVWLNDEGKASFRVENEAGQKMLLASLAGREFIMVPVNAQEPAAGPVKWGYCDKQGSRNRQARCFVVSPAGDVYRFTGQDIPGIVKVLGSDYQKAGKWSSSTFRCVSPAGTVPISWMQDWDTGETFPQDSWEEAFAWLLEKAPQAKMESFEALIRAEFKQTTEKFDANRQALAEMSR